MASGVKVADEVNDIYKKIQLHHNNDDAKDRLKFVKFLIKEEEGLIVVDKNCMIKVRDVEGEEDIYKKLISYLPDKSCCYAIYDCYYTTEDSPKDTLVFILWAPEDAPVKDRLLYASSKHSIKKAMAAAKCELQLNDPEEAKDINILLDRLAAKGSVKLLEGKEVPGYKSN